MTKKLIAGGCSFTFGHELSDDQAGKVPSKMSWAHRITPADHSYVCVASAGAGNSGIARRVFNAVANGSDIGGVVVMWSFLSRYDWAMPRHRSLEGNRWASLSPWDTEKQQHDVIKKLSCNDEQMEVWRRRMEISRQNGTNDFAEALYRHAANAYHETYLSWKSITWLQNILEKKKIPFMFTLADNSLFYDYHKHHKDIDGLLGALYREIDLSKWFCFGERMMGFNQWATLNNYEYATTHPLDEAHEDAVKLMLPTFQKLIGGR